MKLKEFFLIDWKKLREFFQKCERNWKTSFNWKKSLYWKNFFYWTNSLNWVGGSVGGWLGGCSIADYKANLSPAKLRCWGTWLSLPIPACIWVIWFFPQYQNSPIKASFDTSIVIKQLEISDSLGYHLYS